MEVTRFYRDADGNLVKKSDAAGTVMIVNGLYEEAGGVATSYYTFGSQRVAMRVAGAVYWLHGDHLGSASLTTNVSGQKVAELRYLPFGETRWAWGVTPTDRRYTGQREVAGVGLYDYNARMYWPAVGRFVSADTVVPDSTTPQSFNRYAYVLNNPLRYGDPTGHCPAPPDGSGRVICFALFIQPESVQVADGLFTLKGDDRWFNATSNPEQSRGWVEVFLDTGEVNLRINPTTYKNLFGLGADHKTPPSPANRITVQMYKNGVVFLSYDMVLSGWLEGTAPHIDGHIVFQPRLDGTGYQSAGVKDAFPWAEAYYWDGKGNVQTIFTIAALHNDPDNLYNIEPVGKRGLNGGPFPHSLRDGGEYRGVRYVWGFPDVACVPGRAC